MMKPQIAGDRAEDAAASPDTAKRRQILAGAKVAFLEHGFDGASMGDIVVASGVSKATVYAYFTSKEQLFETLILDERRGQAEQAFALKASDHDVAKVLTGLGHSLMSFMTRGETVQIVRLVIAAAGKFPALGRVFFEAGPAYGKARLAEYLQAQVAAGVLRIDDCGLAAWQFVELCKAGITVPMLMGVMDQAPEDQRRRTVESAVAMFMRTYEAAEKGRENAGKSG